MLNEKEYNRQYRLNHREYYKEYNRKYYQKHKEQLKEYARQYDKNNREHNNKIKRIKRKNIRQLIQEYKLSHGCAICGYNRCAAALDFHHISDDKKFCIASAIRNNKGISIVKEEIKKCIVICANCHRELHAKEANDGKKDLQ